MKAYIYCCKSKKDILLRVFNQPLPYEVYHAPFKNKELTLAYALNGSIVAECEVKEAFCFSMPDITKYSETYIPTNRVPKDPISHDELEIRSRLSNEQLNAYGKGKPLYAYHLEHVNPVALQLSDFYEDEACTKPLTKAPQSYRFAYRKEYLNLDKESVFQANAVEDTLIDIDGKQVFRDEKRFDETGEDSYYRIIKVLIFSDHAQYCAKILNGEKDLEVRKTRIAEGVTFK